MKKNKIKFTKMHGLGNDFMVIDAIHQRCRFSAKRIRELADRHRGIGFDQLLLVEPSPQKGIDFFYRIFNADGSEVAQCGNGARCFAQFVYEKGLTRKKRLRAATRARIIEMQLEKKNDVSVNMGIPQLEYERISLKTQHGVIKASVLSLGNPHCVIQVRNIKTAPVQILGAELNQHPQFPQGVNVGFMQMTSRKQIQLRVYERGVGETQSCGSGACAAMVAGHISGFLNDKVNVYSNLGERLQVEWQGGNSAVWLRGSAITVFEGEL